MKASPPLILVVDDEPAIRLFLTDLLEAFGYSVAVASNGLEACAKARSRRPALIISDRHMPDMDGLALLWTLRDDPDLHDIPFIFASGGHDKFLEDEARRYGAAACIPKPFHIQDLRQLIAAVMDRKPANFPESALG